MTYIVNKTSNTEPDVTHHVTVTDGKATNCTCKGRHFRPTKDCRHMTETNEAIAAFAA